MSHLLAALRQLGRLAAPFDRQQFLGLARQIETTFAGVPRWRLRVGLTNNLEQRMEDHAQRFGVDARSIRGWYWRPPTKDVAQALESFFIDTGMDGGPGGVGWRNLYVIFKPLPSPLLGALCSRRSL